MKKILLLFLLAIISLIKAVNYCESNGEHFYESIGCTPIYKRGQRCPFAYNCSPYIMEINKCFYQGKLYKNKEIIQNTTGCESSCQCLVKNQIGHVVCSTKECKSKKLNKKCYLIKELDECCYKEKCPPFKKETKCYDGRKYYREGEYFQPVGTCWECVCKEGFIEGKYDNEFCRRKLCNSDLHFNIPVKNKCAPIFTDETEELPCCPSYFLCPRYVVNSTILKMGKADFAMCNLGNMIFNKGAVFDVTTLKDEKYNPHIKRLRCSCDLPPLFACTPKESNDF